MGSGNPNVTTTGRKFPCICVGKRKGNLLNSLGPVLKLEMARKKGMESVLQPNQAQKSCPSQDSTPMFMTREFLSKGLLPLTPSPEKQEPILANKQQRKSNQGEESALFSVFQEQRTLLDSEHQ